MSVTNRTPFVLSACLLLGCSPGAGPENAPMTLELEEDLRIGGLEGGIEYTFGYVSALAPAPDGSFYVADRQGPVLRHYSSDGRHIGDLGSPGQGPGELGTINGLGVTASGEVGVLDAANARVTWFAPDGTFVDSYPLMGALGSGRSFVVERDGSVVVQVWPDGGLMESEGGFASDWARVDRSGEMMRLWPAVLDEDEGPSYVVAGRGGFYRPFTTMNLAAMGPEGSYFAGRNDEYRIVHRRPDGTVSEVSRVEERVRVTADERRDWEGFSELGASRPNADRSDYFPIPDTKPYFRELAVDQDGRLWVSRYTEARFMEYSEWEAADRAEKNRANYNWRDLLTWDVFSPDDEYLGAVTFPFKTTFVTAHGDAVWGILAGDYNEDHVIRWRLRVEGGADDAR